MKERGPMKNKLVLVAVSLLVTVWPFILLMYLRSIATSGSIMMAVVFYFNLIASIIASAICWGSTAANKPGGFIAAGIVVILPIVYFIDFIPVVIMILCVGTLTILTGFYFRSKSKTVHVAQTMNRWDWIYLGAVLVLMPLHYWMVKLAPVPGRAWADFYSYAQIIMVLVILLAVCALIFKERIFIGFSVFMLAMATMTLNDSVSVQFTGSLVVLYGIVILIKTTSKPKKNPDPQSPTV